MLYGNEGIICFLIIKSILETNGKLGEGLWEEFRANLYFAYTKIYTKISFSYG